MAGAVPWLKLRFSGAADRQLLTFIYFQTYSLASSEKYFGLL